MYQFVFQVLQQVLFGLLNGEARNPLQHFKLALFNLFCLFQAMLGILDLFLQGFFLFFEVFQLPVQVFFLLIDTALLTLDF